MRSVLFAILLLPATCSGGHSTLSSQPSSLRVGEAALEGGVPQAALSVAQRRLATNRDDLEALLIQGRALSELGENDNGIDPVRWTVCWLTGYVLVTAACMLAS